MSWICTELSRLLGLTATEDLAQYLISMESSRDVEDYLQSMLDLSNPEHRQFVEMLLNQLGHTHETGASQTNYIPPANKHSVKNLSSGSKKRVKQVNLFSSEGRAKENVILPGQHKCECQATKHPLIRNCLECGRVICAQEGPGPCIFCSSNNLQATKRDAAPASAAKKGGKKKSGNAAAKPSPNEAFENALAHKERLLEYDRTSEHRTRVIDDESDYFKADGNRWLNPKQKEILRAREQELREKRHGSKREIKVTLDFAGRQLIEETNNFDELFTEQYFEEHEGSQEYYDQYTVNPLVDFPRPIFEYPEEEEAPKPIRPASDAKGRVQDTELQKMSDQGKCLSMHQPYASLLIAGIKIHEGRSWYSSHRGRMWIASTVKVPTPEEIKELEDFYRGFYGKDLVFPKSYPSGCLLGCVEVVDVLPQDQYRVEYPNGESGSPYVFVCRNPLELFVKFPMKGQHKLYKLDAGVHQTAKKSLQF